ncbi:MAG TPA: hypothetical protein PK598_08255 [Thermoanaerobaculia bacterium]|nr:hypothetical protein [Thermoanaerobaculia bacterium]
MRQVLGGALYAGLREARERYEAPPVGGTPLLVYIYALAAMYQTTRETTPLMERLSARFASEGRDDVAAYCRRVAEEERGHDELVLRDLESLGVPAGRLGGKLRPRPAVEAVERIRRYSRSDRPVAVFGYAYAQERTALFTTAAQIDEIERALPPGSGATRCLRVHSAEGSERGHVEDGVAFVASLCGRERSFVARAVYETSRRMVPPHADYPGDEAMRSLLGTL